MNALRVLMLLAAGLTGTESDNGLADVAAALLAEWITASRDMALAEGAAAIPDDVRAALSGYVPESILDQVRWRVGGGDGASLQQGMLRFHNSPAITLDYVIVFKDDGHAADPKLWVHELMHVIQYRRWGISNFAQRYVQDYAAVEAEAVEYRWQWMRHTGRIPAAPAGPPQP